MSSPGRFTKTKIALGYCLLLVILFFFLWFIHAEIESLSRSDSRLSLQTDSLFRLMKEKDENTIRLLRSFGEMEGSVISETDLEVILAEQDSIVNQQRVQRRIISKRDTIITRAKKKSLFRRIGEVFSPSKKDTAVRINSSLEFATDTLLEGYNPVDSLQKRIQDVSRQREASRTIARRKSLQLRQQNRGLTARIDSLLALYTAQTALQNREESNSQQEIRRQSIRIIAGFATGAVLLAFVFLLIIWRDITCRNRYRIELEQARAKAESLLEAREKMMLTITHDIKAPLSSIMGYIDLLNRITEGERQHFFLRNMENSSRHLLKLVQDLLDFHRLDTDKVEINRVPFNPAALFDEIRAAFEPLAAAKQLAFEYEIAPELAGNYISDPLRLRQVVNNLLTNAVKFTDQGKIILSVSHVRGFVEIAVDDTGKGMTQEESRRIFEEFTRLPGAQGEEGVGLGLSIVRKLVGLMQGNITVKSTPQMGSRFTVRLPLPEADEMPVAPASVPVKSVILIDDDRLQLKLTGAMLEQQQIDYLYCEQPDELLRLLAVRPFDCLLTDIQMPALNGFELLKLLRSSSIPQAQTIPVIAVTARSDMSAAELTKSGFAGCLHKPFSASALMKVIGERIEFVEGDEEKVESEHPDFSALTAFTENDAEATAAILKSFITETTRNVAELTHALTQPDVANLSAISHKMIPLFTLLRSTEIVNTLRKLEQLKAPSLSIELHKEAEKTIHRIHKIITLAQKINN